MTTLFFSYSHRDESFRDELEIHLSALKRDGTIETWHDRRIGVGQEFSREISQHIESSEIILLLVSPYFIASDYCYEIEMRRAMEQHHERSARVIPVILHPCDWHNTLFGNLLATPKDGKPISKFPNQHEGYMEVVRAIREVVAESDSVRSSLHLEQNAVSSESLEVREVIRSSNMRVRKSFTQRDYDHFLEETFEYVARFFEGSLDELQSRNGIIDSRYRRIDANTFAATIYNAGTVASECKISFGSFLGKTNSIIYSNNTQSHSGSINESLSVNDDGHTMTLAPMGMSSFGQLNDAQENKLSKQGAAEYLWAILIRPLQ